MNDKLLRDEHRNKREAEVNRLNNNTILREPLRSLRFVIPHLIRYKRRRRNGVSLRELIVNRVEIREDNVCGELRS